MMLDTIFGWKAGIVLVIGGALGTYYCGTKMFETPNNYPTEIVVSQYDGMKKEVNSIDEKLRYLLSDEGMQKYSENFSLHNKKIDSLTSIKRGIVSSKDYIDGEIYSEKIIKQKSDNENNNWLNAGFGLGVTSAFFGLLIIGANIDYGLSMRRYGR